ncbi:ABC-1 domain-containing protein [Gemmatirosa kalamazoonensis]|uniref:ABC-1 domain-containing protein n=1 Tax=Gemmatirosa kalamazoonensis TaxID=861299 RepID=W0RHV4_9BACT|nr:AarF/UbiB family protein [Gemmatirosa kalamazoonensis]AHG88988.1 ABC-1 domain-containing protein [Gemmatirosa kalamazoonensis]
MTTHNGSNPRGTAPPGTSLVPVRTPERDGMPVLPLAAPATVVHPVMVWWRTVVVAARALPLVLSFVRDHRSRIVRGDRVPRSPAFHARRAARLVETLGRLGPTFVKLAQLLGARADLVPEPYLAALGTLSDQAPLVPLAAVRRTIAREYGTPADEIFEWFDPAPLAAASLGQVHRARWRGHEVAVKVLRPGVERLVAADVRAAERLLALAERWFPNPHLRGVRNAVREFGVRVWEELDFRHEAANAAAMRANFAGRAGVAVPRVEPSLVRRRVLVMEYMPGTRIDRLQHLVASGRLDAEELVRRVIELYMRMMLIDGFFHADPHPGNLYYQEPPEGATGFGTIVVLDFGMVVPVSRELRRRLARAAFAGIRRDADGLVDGFYALGVADPRADRATMRALVDALLDVAYTKGTTARDRIELLADRVMSTLYDFPVTLPGDLVYFARTAALIEGLGARYDTRFNGVTFASPVALRLRREISAALREPGESELAWLGGEFDVVGAVLTSALGGAMGGAVGDVIGEIAGAVYAAGREIVDLIAGIVGPLVAPRRNGDGAER